MNFRYKKAFVYFISPKRIYPRFSGKIRVKIGLAYDPDKRKRQLQTGADRLLTHYRPPLMFLTRENADNFETWAQNYAERKGKRLVYPGGREFFEISPSVVGEIVDKYRRITGRHAPKFNVPSPIGFLIGCFLAVFYFLTAPLRPWIWITTVFGIYCKDKYGITPNNLILTHLFIVFLVIHVSVGRSVKAIVRPVAKFLKDDDSK